MWLEMQTRSQRHFWGEQGIFTGRTKQIRGAAYVSMHAYRKIIAAKIMFLRLGDKAHIWGG